MYFYDNQGNKFGDWNLEFGIWKCVNGRIE
jgi:hypothetical protein